MTRRWWKWILLACLLAPLLVSVYDRMQMMYWVGRSDLEITFAITDVDTGNPIPRARIEIHSEGGFYEERAKQDFVLKADDDGLARKECRNSMSFGTRSALGFTNTFVVHLPFWWYHVVADGFESNEWTDLDVLELRRKVQRAGPGKSTLVVPVTLHRKLSAPGAAAGQRRD